MKVIIAESGEYEQRGIAFVAISAEAALAHLKITQPTHDWELVDKMIYPRPDAPHGGFTPYREWYIAPCKGGGYQSPESRYELSEEEVIGLLAVTL